MSQNPACQTFYPQLSPFIDGELAPTERAGVERHLAVCPDCTGRVADLRAESGLVRVGMEMLADEADFSGFAQKVMARITPERPPLLERWKLAVSELFLHHRAVMISSTVTAVVVALVAVPLILREGAPVGYAQPQIAVQAVKAADANVTPQVMKTETGNTIVWLVDEKGPAADGKEGEQDEREEETGRIAAPPTLEAPPAPTNGGEL